MTPTFLCYKYSLGYDILYLCLGCFFRIFLSNWTCSRTYDITVPVVKNMRKSVILVFKNPAYGRQSISQPMQIVAPIPQKGGQRIPKNPFFEKRIKSSKTQKLKKSENMPKLAIRPLTRGL